MYLVFQKLKITNEGGEQQSERWKKSRTYVFRGENANQIEVADAIMCQIAKTVRNNKQRTS